MNEYTFNVKAMSTQMTKISTYFKCSCYLYTCYPDGMLLTEKTFLFNILFYVVVTI